MCKSKMSLQWSCVVCHEESHAESPPLMPCVPDGCGTAKHFMCKKCAHGLKTKQCPMCRADFNDIVQLSVVGSYHDAIDNWIDKVQTGATLQRFLWHQLIMLVYAGALIFLPPRLVFCTCVLPLLMWFAKLHNILYWVALMIVAVNIYFPDYLFHTNAQFGIVLYAAAVIDVSTCAWMVDKRTEQALSQRPPPPPMVEE